MPDLAVVPDDDGREPVTVGAGGVARRPAPRTAARGPRSGVARALARLMFHAHLWLGVLTAAIVLVVAATGIALNHKRGLGLMQEVEHEASGAFEAALPLAALAEAATGAAGEAAARAGVDRMDVRPDDGLVKVRFGDDATTEVTIDLHSGAVLAVGWRGDVFFEKLHSGEIFGDRWVLLSDIAAVVLVLLLVSGYWLWLYPRVRA